MKPEIELDHHTGNYIPYCVKNTSEHKWTQSEKLSVDLVARLVERYTGISEVVGSNPGFNFASIEESTWKQRI